MTSHLPVVALAGLPDPPDPDDRLYLKPLPDAPTGAPGSVRLAGTPVRFSRIAVMVRRPHEVAVADVLAAEAEAWIASLPDAAGHSLARQLENCRTPRAEFGGVAMDGAAVMGIVNTTPDSFSDGGLAHAAEDAETHGRAMAAAGAAILDIGGESTRPGAEPVSREEELARVVPAIAGLADAGVPVSVDTRHAAVMAAGLDAGATIVNDVSALGHDPESLALVAGRGAPVVLMHSPGDLRTMQKNPAYDHVALDVFDHLAARIAACEAAGIPRQHIAVDPGIGFGKTLEHNLVLLRDLALFHGLGCAVLLGASRKSFIGRLSGEQAAARRGPGSIAAALAGARGGAHILRVHDVADTLQALAVWRAIEGTHP